MNHLTINRDAVLVQLTCASLQGMASQHSHTATIADRDAAASEAVQMAVKAYAALMESIYGEADESTG